MLTHWLVTKMPCLLIFSMSTAHGLPWHIILLQLRLSLLSLNEYRTVWSVTSFVSSARTLSFFFYGMALDCLSNPNLFIIHRCKHLMTLSSDGVLSIYALKYV